MGTVATWINILLRLKDAAMAFDSPRSIVEGLSGDGEERFANSVLLGLVETVQCEGFAQLLREGAQRVQDFAYTQPLPPRDEVEDEEPEEDDEEEGIEEVPPLPPNPWNVADIHHPFQPGEFMDLHEKERKKAREIFKKRIRRD